jgi:hypothetical protein
LLDDDRNVQRSIFRSRAGQRARSVNLVAESWPPPLQYHKPHSNRSVAGRCSAPRRKPAHLHRAADPPSRRPPAIACWQTCNNCIRYRPNCCEHHPLARLPPCFCNFGDRLRRAEGGRTSRCGWVCSHCARTVMVGPAAGQGPVPHFPVCGRGPRIGFHESPLSIAMLRFQETRAPRRACRHNFGTMEVLSNVLQSNLTCRPCNIYLYGLRSS